VAQNIAEWDLLCETVAQQIGYCEMSRWKALAAENQNREETWSA